MAIVYGIEFGAGDTTDLISIWRNIKGAEFDTDALRTLCDGIPSDLDDHDPLFPRIAARVVCKKTACVKFICEDLVNFLAQRCNGYAQVKEAYPKHADMLNYMGIIERVTTKHAQAAAERRNLTWNELCDRRDGIGKTVWECFGVADQSVQYAQ
jgi:hypothetical protein